jgi:hypothetical protein
MIVMYTHSTNPVIRANGSSAANSTISRPYSAQNRHGADSATDGSVMTSQATAKAARMTYPATAAAPREYCGMLVIT